MDADSTLLDQFLDKEEPQSHVLLATCRLKVFTINTGTLSKRVSNPSSSILFEQNADSFNVSAAATNYVSIVDCAVSPRSPTLKFARAFESMVMYQDTDLPLSGLLPQFASENTISLKPLVCR